MVEKEKNVSFLKVIGPWEAGLQSKILFPKEIGILPLHDCLKHDISFQKKEV